MTASLSSLERPVRPATPHAEEDAGGVIIIEATRPWWSQAWSAITGGVTSAWHWLKRTLHLDAVAEKVSSAMSWLGRMTRTGTGIVGPSGFAGLGLLAVSTTGGRKVLDFTLGNLWRGACGVANWLTDRTIDGLGYLGAPGRWMADRVSTLRGLIAGDTEYNGLIPWVKNLASSVFARDTALSSGIFGFLGLTGYVLVAARVLTLISATWLMIPAAAISLIGLVAMAAPIIGQTMQLAHREREERGTTLLGAAAQQVQKAATQVADDASQVARNQSKPQRQGSQHGPKPKGHRGGSPRMDPALARAALQGVAVDAVSDVTTA